MSIRNDLKILYHLVLRPVRGKDHAQRMENFYSGQADGYDDFRKRLLQGREHVYQTLGKDASAPNPGTTDSNPAQAMKTVLELSFGDSEQPELGVIDPKSLVSTIGVF